MTRPWAVKQACINSGQQEGLSTEARTRLAEFQQENAKLRMERDLLRRATAFWTRESTE